MSCTTILVGKNASYDGSTIIARDDDSGSGRYDPKRFVAVAPDDQPRHYRSVLSHVEIELPDNPCRYTIAPNVLNNRGILAEAGANEHNVAMSATETIAVNERVLGADPMVELRPAVGEPDSTDYQAEQPGGIGEEDIITLVLPYVTTAREGVARLGELLETYGTYESNGVIISDVDEMITMAEDIGIGGRAGYYDGIGAARDVIQNHLLQLMALTAMEEPVSFTAKDLTAEKTKVLSAVRLPKDLAANTARGQYAKGWQGSHEVVGYLEEKGIDPKSTTETYAAIRLDIDTRRWAGVPFYLRCGKRLGKRVTEIAVVFKRAPHLPFEQTAVRELGKNAIVIRVQPDEGVTMRFGAKVPGGSTMEVRDVNMDFSYGRSFTENSPEAYERLILDVLLGDPPLFPTTEEVNLSWEILDPIEQFWSTLGQPQAYRAGTWGPAQADEMLARDGRHWRMP